MSTKIVFSCTLVLAVLGGCLVQAQDYRVTPGDLGPPPGVMLDPTKTPAPVAEEAVPPLQAATPGLSHWITYQCPDCCGNVGCNGPIWAELYVLSGVELPVQGKYFGHVLEAGWVVQGGGRTLFFNPAMDRDWNIDLSISNIVNQGQHEDRKIPLNQLVGTPPTHMIEMVSVRQMFRTYVNAAIGREWYFHRPADCKVRAWRIGVSAGARLGEERLELHETVHHVDVISGMFCTMNTDMEIPCGCCTFLAGMRAEWGYNWSDILDTQKSQNASDLQDVNILFTLGVRF